MNPNAVPALGDARVLHVGCALGAGTALLDDTGAWLTETSARAKPKSASSAEPAA
jgi:hypothetical protein